MKKLLLMLIFLVGCVRVTSDYKYVTFTRRAEVPSVVVPIWIDKTFDVLDMNSLENSVAEWNYVLNGHIKLEIVSKEFDMSVSEIEEIKRRDGWIVMKIDSSNGMIKGKNWLAYCDHVSGHYMYIIRDRMRANDVQRIALHEFGHLLGSEHVGLHVMYPYYAWGRYNCIDWATAREVAMHWGMSPDRLNFCVPVTH